MGCVNCIFKESKICDNTNTHNWLEDYPGNDKNDIVEVSFKNRRKEFYQNINKLKLRTNDVVVVESVIGFDMGMVSLTGLLAWKAFYKKYGKGEGVELKKIYRKATESDMLTREKSRSLEHNTLLRARKIAQQLGLEMKLSDVEYQADGRRATFYYIADGRVDFRELIKVYAAEFNTKIEMRQIGARQEAAMVGGVGSCGRELCCSSWRKDLVSIRSNVFKIQNLPPDTQKYTGLCGKLKCCLMYELDTYLEAQEDFPSELLHLETKKGIAYHCKTDVLQKMLWYTFDAENKTNLIAVPLERVKEIINLNKRGIEVDELIEKG